jgi:hypothetical protein
MWTGRTSLNSNPPSLPGIARQSRAFDCWISDMAYRGYSAVGHEVRPERPEEETGVQIGFLQHGKVDDFPFVRKSLVSRTAKVA